MNSKFSIITILFSLFASSLVLSGQTLIVSKYLGSQADEEKAQQMQVFSSEIEQAGGSPDWIAGVNFHSDGTVVDAGESGAAFLKLGSYINDAKGSSGGLFVLSATIRPSGKDWLSMGFFENPNINSNFTQGMGLATIIMRTSGKVDMWAGPGLKRSLKGTEVEGLEQLFTVVLDLTTYNGASDFGSVTWYLGNVATGEKLGSRSFSSDHSFDAIGFTVPAGSWGEVDGIRLVQF